MPLEFVPSGDRAPSAPPGRRRPVDPYDKVPARLRRDSRLSDRAYRLYAAIVGRCWGDARECWPCNATLASDVGGCSHDTVRRALVELVRLGLVECRPDHSIRANRVIRLLDPP